MEDRWDDVMFSGGAISHDKSRVSAQGKIVKKSKARQTGSEICIQIVQIEIRFLFMFTYFV